MLLAVPPRGGALSRAEYDELLAFIVAYTDLLVARWQARDRSLPRPRLVALVISHATNSVACLANHCRIC